MESWELTFCHSVERTSTFCLSANISEPSFQDIFANACHALAAILLRKGGPGATSRAPLRPGLPLGAVPLRAAAPLRRQQHEEWPSHRLRQWCKAFRKWSSIEQRGSIVASHPAAPGSSPSIPENFIWILLCWWDLLTAQLRVKWTDAWKCQLNPSSAGKWHTRTAKN